MDRVEEGSEEEVEDMEDLDTEKILVKVWDLKEEDLGDQEVALEEEVVLEVKEVVDMVMAEVVELTEEASEGTLVGVKSSVKMQVLVVVSLGELLEGVVVEEAPALEPNLAVDLTVDSEEGRKTIVDLKKLNKSQFPNQWPEQF